MRSAMERQTFGGIRAAAFRSGSHVGFVTDTVHRVVDAVNGELSFAKDPEVT
jgi:hypothetical protein